MSYSNSSSFEAFQAFMHKLITIAIFTLFTLYCAPALGSTIVSVGDGDTIRVQDGNKETTVRLACIDAPELAQIPYGARSRKILQTLLPAGKNVRLRVQTLDRFGRTVAEVFTNKGNINQLMVKQGHSFVYRRYLEKCDRAHYISLEAKAQKSSLGVWSVGSAGIQRPWDFRRNKSSIKRTSRSKYRCKEIGSWIKAQELLREGHTYLDRDGDGQACESLQ